jgi:hypothetical protein
MVMELYSVLKPPPLPQGTKATAKRHYAPGLALSAPRDAYTLVLPNEAAVVANPGAVALTHSSPFVD